jgi:glycerol uptake facilitator-like aquaporin
VPHYIFAQFAGAFTAGALVYLNYKDAINGYDKVTTRFAANRAR